MVSKEVAKVAQAPLSFADKVGVVWFALDAVTHLSIEALYVYFTLANGGAKWSSSPLAYIWREYGKADKRWEVYDANVLSLEALTVFIMGPLALMMMYGIIARKPWRHIVQIVICTSELYGGWMTFAPEWFSGNPNLSNDFIHVSVYLFFMNFVWVLVPFILLVDSSLLLQRAVEAPKRVIANQTAIGNGWYWLIAITLVLYVVLVPLILAVTKG